MILINRLHSREYFERLKMDAACADWHLLSAGMEHARTIKVSNIESLNQISRIIANSSCESNWQMLYVSESEIFPSMEDLNLYYTFQKHHGGKSFLSELPGHLFLKHESHELASLIAICIINAFDATILSQNDYSRFHLSHHGFVDVFTNDADVVNSIDRLFEKLKVSQQGDTPERFTPGDR